jgi:hypothetical protein
MTNNPENNPLPPLENGDKPGPTLGTRLLRYSILVLLLCALGLYVWKELAIQNLEVAMEDQRIEMEKERQDSLDARTRAMLHLAARPLAWAVRAEMMQGNLNQIDDYFRDFVREKGVQSIFLIDKENKVVLATNRKLETQPADKVVSQAIQNAENVLVEGSDSLLRLGVPIMSLNEKLGILVVDYEPPAQLQRQANSRGGSEKAVAVANGQ